MNTMEMTAREAIEIISTNPVAYPDPDAQGVWDAAIRVALAALRKEVTINPNEDYLRMKRGDTIWYVDKERGELEQGEIVHISYIEGNVDAFSVDFGDDFDEFYGKALGHSFFLNKENAEHALRE